MEAYKVQPCNCRKEKPAGPVRVRPVLNIYFGWCTISQFLLVLMSSPLASMWGGTRVTPQYLQKLYPTGNPPQCEHSVPFTIPAKPFVDSARSRISSRRFINMSITGLADEELYLKTRLAYNV